MIMPELGSIMLGWMKLTWMYPWMFLFGLLIPFILWFRYWWRGRRFHIPFSNGADLDGLPRGLRAICWPILPLLFGLGLAALIIAMARPREQNFEEGTVSRQVIDIAIVIDVSTSMQALDFSDRNKRRNRLDAAREVVDRFIAERQDDRMCIIAFAGVPYTLSPLTLDNAWLRAQLNRLKIGFLREDGTAIGSALGTAVARLERSEAVSKVVILLTDGINNAGLVTPEDAALLAKARDITVYTVGAGRSGPVPMPTRFGGVQNVNAAPVDDPMLQNIADQTGGKYFRAQNFEELKNVYQAIDQLERTEIEEDDYTSFEDRSIYFIIPGLLLLALEGFLGGTFLRRLTE